MEQEEYVVETEAGSALYDIWAIFSEANDSEVMLSSDGQDKICEMLEQYKSKT